MTDCTSDNSWEENPDEKESLDTGNPDIKDNATYINISISNPPHLSNRGGDETRAVFDDGSESESKINLVRLYFFDGGGNILKLRNVEKEETEYLPYYDWGEADDDTDPESRADNVTKTIGTTLALDIMNGSTPVKLVTVVNPGISLKNKNITSIEELEDLTDDYCTGYTDGNFIMSNASYLKGEGGSRMLINAVDIKRENLWNNVEDAKSHPVTVYVERIVSRIDFSFDQTSPDLKMVSGKNDMYDTGVTFTPKDSPSVSKSIYVKLLGWAVTSTPEESRLLKYLDRNWQDNAFLLENGYWNDIENCRSYWAVNPSNIGYRWFSYDNLSGKDTDENCFPMSKKSAYMHENANPAGEGGLAIANPVYPTKVIFAGQLVDEDEKPVTIVEYEGNQYTESGLLAKFCNLLDLWKPVTDAESNQLKYVKIQPSDLTFETAATHNAEPGPDIEKSFYVYLSLTNDASMIEWYHYFESESSKDSHREVHPQSYIDSMAGEIKIWKDGQNYYFFDILHFNVESDEPGFYGVVRNHIYNATVTSLKSLGSPVYDPEEKIYPDKPDDGGSMLEVEIRTVEWRLVKKRFQVAW